MARLKKLTPLAKAMLVPSLTEAEIKVALEVDEVTNVSNRSNIRFEMHQINFHSIPLDCNKL